MSAGLGHRQSDLLLRVQDLDTDPTALKKQELAASQKKLGDQIIQVETELSKLGDVAQERATKSVEQVFTRLRKVRTAVVAELANWANRVAQLSSYAPA